MKLLYLVNLRLPTEKAYGIQITKTCESLADLGHDVFLVYPFRKNNIEEDIFDYYGVKRNFKFKRIWAPDFYWPGKLDKVAVSIKSLVSALCLSFYALKQKADIIYSRDELPLYFLSFFRKNIVFEAHRYSSKRKFFYQRFKNTGTKTVVISEAIKKEFLKLGFNERNILVAHDGVDLKEFDLSISQEEARKRVGLSLDKKIVMYTGHLFEWKGAASLLEVAKNFQFSIFPPKADPPLADNFQKNTEDILFVFVGGTDYNIKNFREKALGLENVLILGHKSHKEIPVYLKAADILVLPNSAKEDISSKYTSPLKLFEYMASGRPIVASDLSSVREVLNENNSVLVESDNPEALVEGIKSALVNAKLAEKISDQALKDVQNYTWQKRAENIINFICSQN